MMFFGNSGVARSTDLVVKEGLINSQDNLDRLLVLLCHEFFRCERAGIAL